MPSAETLNISQPDLLERSRRGEHLPFDPRRGFRGNQCALGFPARAWSSPDPFHSRRRAPCPHSNLQLEKNFAEHLSLFCRMEMASPRSHFSLKLKRTLHFLTISGLFVFTRTLQNGTRTAVGSGVQHARGFIRETPSS